MEKKFRVAEIFGPTIQGEGRQIGLPSYFIRFGGCDFRCSWCDTPHAVLPDQVAQLPQMTVDEIIEELNSLPRGPRWVVLTGGNPALFDLRQLVLGLHAWEYKVMVETQGTIYHEWLRAADEVCISPKPPSAGNVTGEASVSNLLTRCSTRTMRPYLKCVVFDEDDYQYAKRMHERFWHTEMFLSAGNMDPHLPTVGNPNPSPGDVYEARKWTLKSMRALMERTMKDPDMSDVRVLPQLHVLAWGNERGR